MNGELDWTIYHDFTIDKRTTVQRFSSGDCNVVE